MLYKVPFSITVDTVELYLTKSITANASVLVIAVFTILVTWRVESCAVNPGAVITL